MHSMFRDCLKLEYLELSSFDTYNQENFGYMSCNCESLELLDLSNFKTNNASFLDNMFNGCASLKMSDLSNFHTSKVVNFINMFNGCASLTSLEISNFDITSITQDIKFDDIFKNCGNLEFINFNHYKDVIYNLKVNHFQDTSDNIVICTLNKKLNQEIDNNIIYRNNIAQYWYKYNKKLYDNNKCTDDCTSTSFKFEFQKICYKKCQQGTINRKNDDNLKKYNINYKYYCKPICNTTAPFEMILEQECVENCDIKTILDNKCILNYYEKKTENENHDIILKSLEKALINGDLNTSDIENGNNQIVELKNMVISLTTAKNQKDEKNNVNMTTVNLGVV